MKKALAPILVFALVLGTLALLACEEDDVGIPCEMAGSSGGADAGAAGTGNEINPQALDCRSRLCLAYRGTGTGSTRALCTTTCSGDDDCPDSVETCTQGFKCVPAVETGRLACCKMCVCKKYLSSSTGTSSVSKACENKTDLNCPDL